MSSLPPNIKIEFENQKPKAAPMGCWEFTISLIVILILLAVFAKEMF